MSSPKVLVLGSGVIGLRTALSLSRNSIPVSVRSSVSPLATSCALNASVGAGGLWMPFHCDDDRTDRWAKSQLEDYLKMHSAGDYAVELVPTLSFINESSQDLPSWAASPQLQFQSFSPTELAQQASVNGVHVPPFAEKYGKIWQWLTPIVDCPRLLKSMMVEIEAAGGSVDNESEFSSSDDVLAVAKADGCTVVVNCLGGAGATLIGEPPVTRARGVLKYYSRREDFKTCILVDHPPMGSDTHPIYAIPRGNVVAVGGTYLEGDHEQSMRPEEEEMLRATAKLLLPDEGEGFEEVGEWVGFRPVREGGVKLGLNEEMSGKGLSWIDNFGHGGSGWTVASGCADDVLDIAQDL